MARIATAAGRAEQVTTLKQAARLYNDLEYELALGVDNEDDYDEGERALGILEERFPNVRDQAHQLTSPPKVSRRAGDRMHGGRQREPAAPTPTPARSSRRSSKTVRSEQPPARGSQNNNVRTRDVAREQGRELAGLGQDAGRRAAAAASDALPSGWGDLITYTILGGIGLSLLYLALTQTKGVSELMLGITNSVSALIASNVDPLSPPRAGSTTSVRGTGTSRPVLPRSSPLAQGITLTQTATNTAKGLIP